MESKWGLVPDMSISVTLRELVPIDVAKELTMTHRIFKGEEAKVGDGCWYVGVWCWVLAYGPPDQCAIAVACSVVARERATRRVKVLPGS